MRTTRTGTDARETQRCLRSLHGRKARTPSPDVLVDGAVRPPLRQGHDPFLVVERVARDAHERAELAGGQTALLPGVQDQQPPLGGQLRRVRRGGLLGEAPPAPAGWRPRGSAGLILSRNRGLTKRWIATQRPTSAWRNVSTRTRQVAEGNWRAFGGPSTGGLRMTRVAGVEAASRAPQGEAQADRNSLNASNAACRSAAGGASNVTRSPVSGCVTVIRAA